MQVRLQATWQRGRLAARKVLPLALLWGLGVAASESATLPWQQLDPSALLSFALHATMAWTVVGLLVVGGTAWAVPRYHAGAVLATYLLVVSPLVAWGHGLYLRGFGSYFEGADGTASFSYLLWCSAVHGLLLIAWWIVSERSECTRRLLADAQIARQRSEADLDQARLLALRGQVDPAFVREVMTQVQQRYASDPDAGDRLLDLLVAFLRCAMPAVRSQRSSLADEVALVRAWSSLQREREGHAVAWQVLAPPQLPELAFPPLLLMPVLEQLGRGASSAAPPELQVCVDAHTVTLACHVAASAPALEASLAFRLRVGLQAVHGTQGSLQLRGTDSSAPGLVLSLPLRYAPPETARVRNTVPFPLAPGVTHGR